MTVLLILLLAIVGVGGYKLTRKIMLLEDTNNSLANLVDMVNAEKNELTNSLQNQTNNTVENATNATNASSQTNDTTGSVSQVKIYLVAVGDDGKTGSKIGCGDSLVAVTKDIQETTKPLEAAIKELLALTNRDYGQSGLMTALYQSTLQVKSVSVDKGVANIKLSGTILSGGTCDDPRIVAQLKNTASQFSSVKSVNITVNDVPLDQLF